MKLMLMGLSVMVLTSCSAKTKYIKPIYPNLAILDKVPLIKIRVDKNAIPRLYVPNVFVGIRKLRKVESFYINQIRDYRKFVESLRSK